ncbi:MAG: transcription termination/antitermination protein NusG [Anaerolineae bacterium]|nr:transcription termination/antitermination protein NusG [Anaerolineae bacterium]
MSELEPGKPVAEDAGSGPTSSPQESEPSSEAAGAAIEAKEAAGERRWYVVHSYSGYESRVKKNLEHRIESMAMQDRIFQVIVPTEERLERKEGQRRITEHRVFPGYVFVEMVMDEDSWYVVRNTPGVTGFVGIGNKPTPLPADEVEKIMKRVESTEPKIEVNVKPGQKVRIKEGPFAEFMGVVDDVDADKGKARVLVSFFNRETPIEVDLLQVEKA